MLIDLGTPLLGPAELTPADIIRGIESKTATLGPPAYEAAMLRGIAEALVARAGEFGWRVSIIAGQEMHETRWFRYGGDVPADALNVAGIGATGGVAGARFPRPDAGHPPSARTTRPTTTARSRIGRRPCTRPHLAAETPAPVPVDVLAAALPPGDWQAALIQEGSKGPLVAEVACVRAIAVRDGLPGPVVWVVLRRALDATRELQAYLPPCRPR